MELISKISKGTRMDQIYIPKNRAGFSTGSYVVIKPLETKIEKIGPVFYNISYLEPVKTNIINEILKIIDSFIKNDNIIITGSFLDKGFKFNDVDVLIISDKKVRLDIVKDTLEKNLGIKFHLISIPNKALIKGLETDPLYRMMLGKSVSKKRFVYNIKPKINYKVLDIHLLNSKLLVLNYNFLTGNQKYEMLRNAVAIYLFIEKKELSKELIDANIKKLFKVDVKDIKNNIIEDKRDFSKRYNSFYKALFTKIMKGVKNESKQK